MTKYLDYAGLTHLTEKIKRSIEAAAGTRTAGLIVPYAGKNPPAGYLLCNGAAHDKTLYPELFAAIGTTYGGSGDTFNVPDLNGRVAVGAGSPDGHVEFKLGGKGGSPDHTLSVEEMPSHDHAFQTEWSGTGWAGDYSPLGFLTINSGAIGNGGGLTPIYTTHTGLDIIHNTGGNQPHNNMQPYTVVNYMISTGRRAADNVTADDIVERIAGLEKAASPELVNGWSVMRCPSGWCECVMHREYTIGSGEWHQSSMFPTMMAAGEEANPGNYPYPVAFASPPAEEFTVHAPTNIQCEILATAKTRNTATATGIYQIYRPSLSESVQLNMAYTVRASGFVK